MLAILGIAILLMINLSYKSAVVLRESQRMDSIYRGPIHSTFSNVVNGLVSLRTYERIGYFRSVFMNQLERSCNITFTYFICSRWYGLRLEMICIIFTFSTSVFALFFRG
jgi:hypothetical protein